MTRRQGVRLEKYSRPSLRYCSLLDRDYIHDPSCCWNSCCDFFARNFTATRVSVSERPSLFLSSEPNLLVARARERVHDTFSDFIRRARLLIARVTRMA